MSDLRIDDPAAALPDDRMARRRVEIGGGGFRRRIAGGTIINTFFLVALNALGITQGLLLARLLGAGEYGLWGLLTISFGTLFALAAVGFDDKYIQQDHADQQAAFQIAFTLQCMLCGLFTVIALIAIPLFSVLYDEPKILVPGLLLAVAMPLIALQTPMWIFYRRMQFGKQRLLESLQPVTAFIVTVTLAIAGYGFWSLVIGVLAGSIVASAVAVRFSPYALRFRYERGAIREYATFSWPLFVGSLSGIFMFQIPITIATQTLGAAAVGAIAIASQIAGYTRRVDDIVTQALYPALCAAKDRRDLLFEAFTKSNRLAILWGLPVGVGAALFAPEAVPLLLGDSWEAAVPLLQVLGVSAAIDQIGFNWTALARARAETKILAVGAVLSLIAVTAVGVPALLAYGLPGFAWGLLAGTLTGLGVRVFYLSRLFPTGRIGAHVARSFIPAVPATTVVLAGRALGGPESSPARFAVEAAVYFVLVVAATWLTERRLLREMVGYLRDRARRDEPGVDAPAPAPAA